MTREIIEQVYADVFLDGFNRRAIYDLFYFREYDYSDLINEKTKKYFTTYYHKDGGVVTITAGA